MPSYIDENIKLKREEYDRRKQEEMDSIANAIKSIAESKNGIRFISWILERAGVFRVDYNGRALDLAYQQGQKSIGNELLAMVLEAEPEFFVKYGQYKKTQEIKENGR